jgi:hypothetical protein
MKHGKFYLKAMTSYFGTKILEDKSLDISKIYLRYKLRILANISQYFVKMSNLILK